VAKEYRQVDWDTQLQDDLGHLLQLAVREDLGNQFDWSTVSLIPESATGKVQIMPREEGVTAGMQMIAQAVQQLELDIELQMAAEDGTLASKNTPLAMLSGSVRDLLTTERIVLNFLGRMMGIATLTKQFVDEIAGTKARLYDTRKTTPGWRRLEKYAVRCGGGTNHRTGLNEAVMLKDNHLAWYTESTGKEATLADLVPIVRTFLIEQLGQPQGNAMILEIEVDTLEQLQEVLPSQPDIILLDNMPPATLQQAIQLRDQTAPNVELEASGGITLTTIRNVAESGVDRISAGCLTHSAINFDVGYDWQ